MITDTCEFVYEHHAGGDLSQTYIGRGAVDAIPTPSAALSQFSEDDLFRNTYSLDEILMCHPSLRIIWHCHGNFISKFVMRVSSALPKNTTQCTTTGLEPGLLDLVSNIYLANRKRLYIVAELRRPEGPPSGAPYSYRKVKETHELIFSWLSWLVVLLAGAYARRQRRRRRRRSRATWRPYSK